jgi:hypothetical protein
MKREKFLIPSLKNKFVNHFVTYDVVVVVVVVVVVTN